MNDTEGKARSLFGDHAASAMVPLEAVMAAAAHTFNSLDVEQQVELIEEACERMKASQAVLRASEDAKTSMREGDTTIICSSERDQMRDDLIYRLMHHRFDAVYAIGLRLSDAPEGADFREWLVFSRRPDEVDVPSLRAAGLLQRLIEAMRKGRQRFETLRVNVLRVK